MTFKLRHEICVREKEIKSTRECWVFMVEGPACTKAFKQEGPSTVMKPKEAQ